MAFIPVPNTAQIRMQYVLFGQQCENVFHVEQAGAFDAAKLQAIAQVFANWFITTHTTHVSQDVSLQRVIARDLTTQSGLSVEYTSGLPHGGSIPQVSEPGNVTVSAKWTTGLAGRSYRGRTYTIGIPVGVVVGNSITTAYQGQLKSSYEELITDLAAVPLAVTFVVVSRFTGNAPRATGVTTPIIGVSVEENIDSQRRRLRGRGN